MESNCISLTKLAVQPVQNNADDEDDIESFFFQHRTVANRLPGGQSQKGRQGD